MRILILSDQFPPDQSGGAGRVAFTQAQALMRAGAQVQVLSVRRSLDDPPDDEIGGVPVHRLHIDYPQRWRAYLSLFNPAAARQVGAFLRDWPRPHIVHAHNVHTYLAYSALAQVKQHRLPLVMTAHDVMPAAYQKFQMHLPPDQAQAPTHFDYRVRPAQQIAAQRLRYFPLRNLVIRGLLARHVDVLLTPSQALQDFLRANRITAHAWQVVPNGINLAEWQAAPQAIEAFKARHGLTGRQVMLFPGRLSRLKGSEQLLQALPAIAEACPQAVLLLLGPRGGHAEEMALVAESRGLGQHIRFAGWLSGPELAAAFGASQVVMVPSICFDSFPTVALEAQAAGAPVVGTCFGGLREIVKDGVNGYIINPYNVGQLAARTIDLLKDSALHAQMALQARLNAQHFAADHWAAQLMHLYEDLMSASKPSL